MKEKELIYKITKEFPDIRFKTTKIVNNGCDHTIIIIDNKYIFRFPKTKQYQKKIKIEMNFLNKFNTSIQIPKYEFISKDKSFGGYKIIIGKRLTKTKFQRLTKSNQKKLAKNIGIFLSDLHALNPKKTGLKKEWSIKQQSIEFHKRKRKIYSVLSQKEKLFVKKFIKIWSKLKVPKKYVPIHFDLTGDHILINNQSIGGIIDFGDAALGDPASDFAWFWTCGEEFIHDVYNNYSLQNKSLLVRSKYYYFAFLLSSLYQGVIEKNNQQIKIALNTISKMMKNKIRWFEW